ncbi:MAG: hypothetical protein LUD81_09160 [Clostridiales bacterium]|nr:hypothetical protein [Clostridiales bacterium]
MALEGLENIETPESKIEVDPEAKDTFEKMFSDDYGESPADVQENDLKEVLNDYYDDLQNRSDCPETLPENPIEASDLEKLSPEEVAEKREEFNDIKGDLKSQWETKNGQEWPKYEEDVYSANGKIIRQAGGDYDAHHIQPLSMGGKNEVDNITPLHANEHYDKQGIHSPDSPYSKLDTMLGGR